MNYIIAFTAGFAACYAVGVYRHRKQNPGSPIGESLVHTLNTAWRPPK